VEFDFAVGDRGFPGIEQSVVVGVVVDETADFQATQQIAIFQGLHARSFPGFAGQRAFPEMARALAQKSKGLIEVHRVFSSLSRTNGIVPRRDARPLSSVRLRRDNKNERKK
jgi:hypothetical protein